MQNKRTWLYLILMLILFTLICAQQQQINDLRDDLSTLQEQTVQIEKQLTSNTPVYHNNKLPRRFRQKPLTAQ